MFEIYGRNNCIWCDRAKELLDSKNLEYDFANVEENKYALSSFKTLFPTAKSVPQIAVWNEEGEYKIIGGYTELVEWLKHYTPSS